MTVKELKEKLANYDDSLEVGGFGHFGELLEVYSVWRYHNDQPGQEDFVVISIEPAGEEPD